MIRTEAIVMVVVVIALVLADKIGRDNMSRAHERGPIAVLGMFESSSSNKQYEVRVGSDEVVYCTCPGWRFHRNCKHIKSLGLKPGKYTP